MVLNIILIIHLQPMTYASNSTEIARNALSLPNKICNYYQICNYYLSHLTIPCLLKLPFSKYKYFPIRCLSWMSWWRQLNTNPRSFFPLLIFYFNWIKSNPFSNWSLMWILYTNCRYLLWSYLWTCLFIYSKWLKKIKWIKNW